MGCARHRREAAGGRQARAEVALCGTSWRGAAITSGATGRATQVRRTVAGGHARTTLGLRHGVSPGSDYTKRGVSVYAHD
ncbi:hypothetical protein GCM10027586_09970 [Kineococcus gypseus]